jgi:hypothetical protein
VARSADDSGDFRQYPCSSLIAYDLLRYAMNPPERTVMTSTAPNAALVALQERAAHDPELTARLLADPGQVLVAAGVELPADGQVEVQELSPADLAALQADHSAELSEAALADVTGGVLPFVIGAGVVVFLGVGVIFVKTNTEESTKRHREIMAEWNRTHPRV